MFRNKLLLGLLILLSICPASLAADYIDCSASQRDYGAVVATQAKPASSRKLAKAKGAPRTLILLKTDGGAVDWDELDADLCVAGPGHRYTLFFASPQAASDAVDALSGAPHVCYAELDSDIAACDLAPRDSIDFNSYGSAPMGFDALLSWARRETGSATVAVIDSGVTPHDLFADRLLLGYDYVDGDDDPTNDAFGHGTHVAGIVADCTRGAAVNLLAIRVMDARGGGRASNAANAILEAIDLGIPIINLSFAGTTSSAALDDAVLNAVSSGCTVVVAAGNGGMDTSGVWPAHLTDAGVIVVGAANADGALASYSNYGESVDCLAFGTDVLSCAAGGGYETRTGTSQAAPHVAAACALLRIVRGNLSPAALEAQVKAAMSGDALAPPQLDRLVPRQIEAHLSVLTLGVGETLPLPLRALPLTCGAEITWVSSAPAVLDISGGTLTARSPGTAELIGRCANFEPIRAQVTVTEASPGRLTLPSALTELASGALEGTGALRVEAGAALTDIAPDALDPGALLLCPQGSPAAERAEAIGIQYIAADPIP